MAGRLLKLFNAGKSAPQVCLHRIEFKWIPIEIVQS